MEAKSGQINKEVLYSIPAEILVLFNQLTNYEKAKFIQVWDSYTRSPSLDHISYSKRIVLAISRAELPLTAGITNLGATIALFQGEIPTFLRLVDPETNQYNPESFNLMALYILLFKGHAGQALDWINKTLEIGENRHLPKEIQALYPQTELFAYILSYYGLYMLGEVENANYASEEANRLMALSQYKFDFTFFWYWYFKAKVELQYYQNYNKVLQYIEDAFRIATKYKHRIFQGLAVQIKGAALRGRLQNIQALRAFQDAQLLYSQSDSIFRIALYSDLADLEGTIGRYPYAQNYYQNTVIEGLAIDAPLLQIAGLKGVADLFLIQGRFYLAKFAYERALKVSREIQTPFIEAQCLTALGCMYTDLKQYDKAEKYLMESLNIREEFGLNKTSTILELGRISIISSKIKLSETIIFLLRNTIHSGLRVEIGLFEAQIAAKKKQFTIAQRNLERLFFTTRVVHGTENLEKVRIQLALAQIALLEAIEENDAEIIENTLEEITERLERIKPIIKKPSFPNLQVIFALLEIILSWLENKKQNKSIILQKILRAQNLSQTLNLSNIERKIDSVKRIFSRSKVIFNYKDALEFIDMLDRNIVYISRKVLE